MSPSVVSVKADTYSFGILLWEVASQKAAFMNHRKMKTTPEAFGRRVIAGERPPFKNRVFKDAPLRDLIEKCWHPELHSRPTMDQVVTELQDIQNMQMLKEDISDECGYHFWRDSFASENPVRWDRFAEAFCAANGPQLDPFEMQCLKAVLVSVNESVERSAFGKIIGWFGPLQLPRDSLDTDFLDTIRDALKTPYFHGHQSSAEAGCLLMDKPHSFLVRFSGTTPNNLCFSYCSDGKIVNVLIPREGRLYCVRTGGGAPLVSGAALQAMAAVGKDIEWHPVTTRKWDFPPDYDMSEAVARGGYVDDNDNGGFQRARTSDLSRPQTAAKQAKTSETQGLRESAMEEDEEDQV